MVNERNTILKPSYYSDGNQDLIDVFPIILSGITNPTDSFIVGNIVKYVTRFTNKNGVQDLEKARTYLDRLIEIKRGANE